MRIIVKIQRKLRGLWVDVDTREMIKDSLALGKHLSLAFAPKDVCRDDAELATTLKCLACAVPFLTSACCPVDMLTGFNHVLSPSVRCASSSQPRR